MDKLESEEHDFGTDPTVTRDIVTTLLPVGKLVGNWCLDLLGMRWTDLVKYLESSVKSRRFGFCQAACKSRKV